MSTHAIADSLTDSRERLRRSYEGFSITPGESLYIERHLRRTLRTLRLLPDAPGRLLDAGCFPGHMSVLASGLGWSVTGVSMLKACFECSRFSERMKRSGVDVVSANLERDELPLADASFDAAIFSETVEHLAFNPFHALDQIWRTLKPGGFLLFSVPNLASFDHLWALVRGRSFHPELSRSLEEAFHADVGERHVREYAPQECRYLLAGQDKYLYEFEVERLVMDRSWDGVFYTEHGEKPSLASIRPGILMRALCTLLWPPCRSNIIMLARKPEHYFRLKGDCIESQGFHEPELAVTQASIVRQPLRSCWMTRKAVVKLRLPPTARAVRRVDFLIWMPAPASAPPLTLEARIGDRALGSLTISPSREPKRQSLSLPSGVNVADGVLAIDLQCNGWAPREHGIGGDDRVLGPMFCLDQVGVRVE